MALSGTICLDANLAEFCFFQFIVAAAPETDVVYNLLLAGNCSILPPFWLLCLFFTHPFCLICSFFLASQLSWFVTWKLFNNSVELAFFLVEITVTYWSSMAAYTTLFMNCFPCNEQICIHKTNTVFLCIQPRSSYKNLHFFFLK